MDGFLRLMSSSWSNKIITLLPLAASKRETEVGKGSGRDQEAKRGTRTGKSKIARRSGFVKVNIFLWLQRVPKSFAHLKMIPVIIPLLNS